MPRLTPIIVLIICLSATACQQGVKQDADGKPAIASPSGTAAANPAGQAGDRPVAYVAGEAVRWSDLTTPLLEAAGGTVLEEIVLDRMIARRLSERNITITQSHLDRERELLWRSFDPDPDRAQRMLNDLRRRRGLGQERFDRLIHRNAALRELVRDQVQITQASLDQAYQYRYGMRYEARLIITDTLTKANELVRRAREGESFIDLAIEHSLDESQAQGGLLPPISPVDTSFPSAIRKTLAELEPGQISDPVSIEQGLAVLKLERKIAGQTIAFETVKEQLQAQVRLQAERLLMEQLAAGMIGQANLVVLDPALNRSWKQLRSAAEAGQ